MVCMVSEFKYFYVFCLFLFIITPSRATLPKNTRTGVIRAISGGFQSGTSLLSLPLPLFHLASPLLCDLQGTKWLLIVKHFLFFSANDGHSLASNCRVLLLHSSLKQLKGFLIGIYSPVPLSNSARIIFLTLVLGSFVSLFISWSSFLSCH